MWFGHLDPATHPNAATRAELEKRVFWNRYGRTNIPAGEYLVVALATTHIGSQDDDGDLDASFDTPSQQVFTMDNTTTNFPKLNYTGDFAYPDYQGKPGGAPLLNVKSPWMMIAASNPPTTWANLAKTANAAPSPSPWAATSTTASG